MTTTWTDAELSAIGATDELRLSSLRADGTLGKPVTIWVARVGDDLYVRSVRGAGSAWFRGTRSTGKGHVSAGGVSADVAFDLVGDASKSTIDAAYQAKYSGYPASFLSPMLAPAAQETTMRLVPAR